MLSFYSIFLVNYIMVLAESVALTTSKGWEIVAFSTNSNELAQFNQSKKGSKDQESIQSSTTPVPGYHMGKWQKYNKTSQTRGKRSALS